MAHIFSYADFNRQTTGGGKLRHVGLIAFLLFTTPACLVSRVKRLEIQSAELEKKFLTVHSSIEQQTFQTDSVAKGLEKAYERLEIVMPSNAQWLPFRAGAAIKWYLDEQAQNVYVQFLEPGTERGSVSVSITTRARTSELVMQPGDAVEHRWTTPARPRSFIITCHRLLFAEDRTAYALFSLTEGVQPRP